MTIHKIQPIFGTAYNIGWLGFTRTYDAVGDAIAYGERFEQAAGMPSVNHVFIATGNDECIQAHIDNGVQRGKISDYLDDPKSRVYFREPIGLDSLLGLNIALSAETYLGQKYDDLLIAENALADTLAGHAINELFHDWPHEEIDRLIQKLTPGEVICSFLGAAALAAQPCFKGLPLFQKPLSSISPQLLMGFGPFEDFVNQCVS